MPRREGCVLISGGHKQTTSYGSLFAPPKVGGDVVNFFNLFLYTFRRFHRRSDTHHVDLERLHQCGTSGRTLLRSWPFLRGWFLTAGGLLARGSLLLVLLAPLDGLFSWAYADAITRRSCRQLCRDRATGQAFPAGQNGATECSMLNAGIALDWSQGRTCTSPSSG
jgi:hypothetical protein